MRTPFPPKHMKAKLVGELQWVAPDAPLDADALLSLVEEPYLIHVAASIVQHHACTLEVVHAILERVSPVDDPSYAVDDLCISLYKSPWRWDPDVVYFQVECDELTVLYVRQATLDQYRDIIDFLQANTPFDVGTVVDALTLELVAQFEPRDLAPYLSHHDSAVREKALRLSGVMRPAGTT